jgi:catechol 2,3-dioxygenase-like lactoylglutathione lyase family enzyme
VKRTSIFCRDIEASLALYRDILGFEVVEDKHVEGPAIAGMVGLEDCRFRICHLRAGDGADGLIGLYCVSEAVPPMPEVGVPESRSVAYGQTAIVVETGDPETIHQRVAAGGYRFITPPREYVKETDGDYIKAGRYTEMIFADPDGVLVSVLRYRAP